MWLQVSHMASLLHWQIIARVNWNLRPIGVLSTFEEEKNVSKMEEMGHYKQDEGHLWACNTKHAWQKSFSMLGFHTAHNQLWHYTQQSTMDLLILYGYGSHVISEVGLETQVLKLHMFILPTHGSHALPPLDVKHCF
jgi:hypothetical protein